MADWRTVPVVQVIASYPATEALPAIDVGMTGDAAPSFVVRVGDNERQFASQFDAETYVGHMRNSPAAPWFPSS